MTIEEKTKKIAKLEKTIQRICDVSEGATYDFMRGLESLMKDYVSAIAEIIVTPLQHEHDELMNTKAEDE